MKTCKICGQRFEGRAESCSLECRDAATKQRRHARHMANYQPKPRMGAAAAGACKVYGAACSGQAKTCSGKCRKVTSRKRQRISAERQRLGLR